ncbi:translation initiation factor IF-2 [Phoenix dactylifera]|uniref:Translation initiation factor IF-2 n=1 Tax=Phoenix dactylifera TaxID=42345 RepID=A0A8B7D4H4_PHODC|nr:translation initiation factor IF-2 [Phoenix dactylifera]
MTSHYPSDLDSSAAGSAASTPVSGNPRQPPPSRWQLDDPSAPRVRLMCSFGGRILPRPHDHLLRYVGGDTRIVAVPRSITFSALLSKLSKLAGGDPHLLAVRYQLPNEDLDALISVSSDEDVENMMDEYDRLSVSSPGGGAAASSRTPRLRLFLFSPSDPSSGHFGSVIDGPGPARHHWFVDALNGLERSRSEASSVVSEVPDYLFGLETNSDEPAPTYKTRTAYENASDPGSPAPATPSPHYRSASSAPPIPPVKTKPDGEENRDVPVEPQVNQPGGYVSNPAWQYMPEPVPAYFVPGPVSGGSLSVGPVAMPAPYLHPVAPMPGGQIPVGYQQPVHRVMANAVHAGTVYVDGPPTGRPAVTEGYKYPVGASGYDVPAGGGLMRYPGATPVYPTAGISPVGGDSSGSSGRIGRASQ